MEIEVLPLLVLWMAYTDIHLKALVLLTQLWVHGGVYG